MLYICFRFLFSYYFVFIIYLFDFSFFCRFYYAHRHIISLSIISFIAHLFISSTFVSVSLHLPYLFSILLFYRLSPFFLSTIFSFLSLLFYFNFFPSFKLFFLFIFLICILIFICIIIFGFISIWFYFRRCSVLDVVWKWRKKLLLQFTKTTAEPCGKNQ